MWCRWYRGPRKTRCCSIGSASGNERRSERSGSRPIAIAPSPHARRRDSRWAAGSASTRVSSLCSRGRSPEVAHRVAGANIGISWAHSGAWVALALTNGHAGRRRHRGDARTSPVQGARADRVELDPRLRRTRGCREGMGSGPGRLVAVGRKRPSVQSAHRLSRRGRRTRKRLDSRTAVAGVAQPTRLGLGNGARRMGHHRRRFQASLRSD